MKKAVVVIPTYNESGNIERIMRAINKERRAFTARGYELHILVADDLSPDGTGDIVNSLKKSIPNVHLRSGKKQGLGAAYVRMFDYVVKETDYDVLIQMDADFSHDPKNLKRILDELNDGSSFVVGSRAVEGGSIPGNWPLIRVINTRVANFVARNLGGIQPGIQDLTAGFRAFKTADLRHLNYAGNSASGYAFQINLSNEMLNSGKKVSEIPINFADRTEGDSKIGLADIINFFIVSWQLNNDSPLKQLMRYVLVGASGVVVNLVSLYLLKQQGLPSYLAEMGAIELSILSNFVGHSLLTFQVAKKYGAHIDNEFIRLAAFHGTSAISALVIFTTSISLQGVGINPLIAQFNGIAIAAAINYVLSTRVIWGPYFRHA